MFLYAENFLPYKIIQVKLPSTGITQITGKSSGEGSSCMDSNGVGKSAILALIEWVLFGITRGSADSVINASTGKNCMGRVDCYGKRNQQLTITRYRKHSKHKNSVQLLINGQKVENTLDIQYRIEDELGFDQDTFLRTCVFDQEASVARIKDTSAKKFFEKLLNLDFTDWHEHAKNLRDEKQAQIDKLTNKKEFTEQTLQEVTQSIETNRINQHNWTLNRVEEHKILTTKLATLGDEITNYKEQLKETEQLISSVQIDQAALQHKLSLASQIRTLQSTLESSRLAVATNQPQPKPTNNTCPTCGQTLPANDVYNILQKWEKHEHDRQQRIQGIQQNMEETSKKITQLVREHDGINMPPDTTEKQERLDHLLPHRTQLGYLLKSTETEHTRTQNTLSAPVQDPYKIILEQLEINYNSKKTELENTQQQLIENQHNLDQLNIIVKMFSKEGLQSYMLDRLIPVINSFLKIYLDKITDGEIQAAFSLTTDTGKEKLHLTVQRKNGGNTYESLSSGEAARLDVCLILALHRYLKEKLPTPMLILDDVFDKIDTKGIERTMNTLLEIAHSMPIIIISHNRDLTRYAHHVLTVSKKDRVSTITEGYNG